MTRFVLSVAALSALLAAPAAASSAEAWAEHEKQVTAACLAASGLKDAKAHTGIMLFDDSVGFDALIVEGEGAGDHPKGDDSGGHDGQHHAMVLCLFDKKTGKASVAELHHK